MSVTKWALGTIIAFLASVLLYSSIYVVTVYESAIVTRFGKVVATKTEPGLNFKAPFIETVTKIDNRLREWDGVPSDLQTIEKENIEVNTWARWRVTDPLKFYLALKTEEAAQSVLDNRVDASVKNVISKEKIMEAVRNTNRSLEYDSKELEKAERDKNITIELGRTKLVDSILRTAQGTGGEGASTDASPDEADSKLSTANTEATFGFQIEGIGIKHINYVKPVIPSIYDRMRSERIRIANRYESEGKEQQQQILGALVKELDRISSEGYKKAAIIRGRADATVLKTYADAYGKDADFFSYSRSLELLELTLNNKTRLVMSTDDHDFLKYIKGYERSVDSAPSGLPAVEAPTIPAGLIRAASTALPEQPEAPTPAQPEAPTPDAAAQPEGVDTPAP